MTDSRQRREDLILALFNREAQLPASARVTLLAEGRRAPSDYIAYFDETGDHGLDNIDPAFPIMSSLKSVRASAPG
jgi:hypothetical protein